MPLSVLGDVRQQTDRRRGQPLPTHCPRFCEPRGIKSMDQQLGSAKRVVCCRQQFFARLARLVFSGNLGTFARQKVLLPSSR